MGSQAQDAALGAGFGLLRLPACVIKVNTAHCALCHCLPPPPRTSSASAHPCCWAGAGVSSGNGCAAPALHPSVEAACPGARPWRGHNSQGLALSFPCLWFQRNFLHFFLSAALPGWAELGYTSGNTPPHAGQELPGPAGLDAASRLQQFIPEICIHEALLS